MLELKTITFSDNSVGVGFCDLVYDTKVSSNKRKKKRISWTSSKFETSVLKRHHQDGEKTTHEMEENICKAYIRQHNSIIKIQPN